jgi:hypothetical protein
VTVEDRIRQAITIHWDAGFEPRSVHMSPSTYYDLVGEVNTRMLFWQPVPYPSNEAVICYMGIKIRVETFMPDGEVVIGV